MLLSTIITGGTLYVGVKAYEKRQKKKKKPWTFYAERLERNRVAKQRGRKNHALLSTEMPSQIAYAQTALVKFYQENIGLPFLYAASGLNTRSQQLKEISKASDQNESSEVEQKLNRELAISCVSLALATGGALLYSPLSLLSVPGICWIGVVACQDAYQSFKEGRGIGINVLDVLFYVGSLVTGSYFAGALGATFARLGKKLLSKTEDQSRQSLINVFGNQTRLVWLLKDGAEVEIPVEALSLGDIIVAHAGETIAVDGKIISGMATIDQHILTGESQPAEKKVGEQVFASTVVLSGQILIEVEKAGSETVAAQIGDVLNQTADFKSEIQSWGEEIADTSARVIMGFSALVWPFFGATTAVTVLNSCFGLYMRVLGPLSMLSYLNLASQQGLLLKDGRSLQLLTKIDTVVFDKTGTLTLEQPHVAKIHTCLGIEEEKLLTVAAAAEYKQTHPIALAILGAAKERGLTLAAIGEAKYEIGYGLKVSIPNHAPSASHDVIQVGSARFMEMEGILIPPDIKQLAEVCKEHGHSFVYVAINDQLAGAIELHATIRPEAKQVVSELRKRNMSMYIISGDHEEPTKKLAQELGIDNYFAETLPENTYPAPLDKADLISKLQEEGKSVCFVGDGINDSIPLKKANVSISLRGASSAATDTAQIILMNQDLNQLICAFDVAQHFERNMKLNLTTTIVPGLITIYGAFFLGFGIVHSVISNNTGLMIGVSNAIWPWLKEQKLGHRAPRPLIPLEKKEDKLLIDSEKFSQKEDFIRRLP